MIMITKDNIELVYPQITNNDLLVENKTKMKFDIFINGNELYLRFHSGEMFEVGNLKNGPLDKNAIQKYFYMLNFTYNLSNKLINVVNDTAI